MGLFDYFRGVGRAVLNNTTGGRADVLRTSPQNRYAKKRAYYDKVDLFENLSRGLKETEDGRLISHLKGLRNPARRVVEFYAAHVCPGDLPDALPIDGPERLKDPVGKVFGWSNWATKKQVAVRWQSRDGDLFMQAVKPEGKDKTYVNLPDAAHVTELEKDENDFVTLIRLDVPKTRKNRDTGEAERYMRTEVWSKEEGRMRVWERTEAEGAFSGYVETSKLGPPKEERALSEDAPEDPDASFIGANFVPFVHVKFSDEGGAFGVGAYEREIPTIDELCRMATRLHSMFFRYDEPLDVVESSYTGPDGQQLPPPAWEDRRSSTGPGVTAGLASLATQDERDLVEVAGRKRVSLPSGWTLKPNSSAVDYDKGLRLIAATIEDELEPSLPELAYDRLRKKGGELSGRAIQLHLSDAEAKGLEARGHFEAGLVRVLQMCLTLAQVHGLDGFSEERIGTFDNGDFEFSFEKRPLIPIPEIETLELEAKRIEVEEAKKRANEPEAERVPTDALDRSRQILEGALANGSSANAAEQDAAAEPTE